MSNRGRASNSQPLHKLLSPCIRFMHFHQIIDVAVNRVRQQPVETEPFDMEQSGVKSGLVGIELGVRVRDRCLDPQL